LRILDLGFRIEKKSKTTGNRGIGELRNRGIGGLKNSGIRKFGNQSDRIPTIPKFEIPKGLFSKSPNS
jgi:hypothetical protein